jgi:hypothetical protein
MSDPRTAWRCEGCGAWVEPDHGDDLVGRGHTLFDKRGELISCGQIVKARLPD